MMKFVSRMPAPAAHTAYLRFMPSSALTSLVARGMWRN